MKKIIIITFLMSVFMLSYSFAQAEYDWDEQGVQSLSFFESIINSLTTGSTIPSGCDYLSYQQKVFDADDKIHLDAVGNSCKEGDYIKMFSCGLDTQYSSVSQCNYGGSIREGSYKIEDIDLNPSYRYMYFCYDCEAGETSPKTVCENSGLSFGGVFDKSICVGDKSGAYSCQNGGFYCYSGSNNYYYCNLDYALNFVPCKSGEECINGY